MDREELTLILSTSILGVMWGANSLATPLYLSSLHYNATYIGVLIGVSTLTASGLSVVSGFLADSYGRRKFITLNRLLSITGLFLFGIFRIPLGYVIVNQFGGSLTSALLAEKSRNLEKSLSLQSSIMEGFVILGNLLGGLLPFQELYIVEICFLITSLVMIRTVSENYERRPLKFRMSSIGIVGKFSVDSLIGLGAGALLPLISLWFNIAYGVGRTALAPVFILSQASLAVGTFAAPSLGRVLGKVRAIVITHAAAIVVLFVIPLSATFVMAASLYVVRNVLMNMTSPLFSSMILQMVPRDERSRAQTIIQLMDSIPRAVGPTLGGYFLSLNDLYLPFLFTGSLYLTSTVLFFFMFRGIERKG